MRELRTTFDASRTLPERIEAFRAQRVGDLLSGNTPVPLEAGQRVILHLLPLASLTAEVAVDLRSISETHEGFFPLRSERRDNRFNFDGRVVAPFPDGPDRRAHAYLQIFRSGVLEAVSASLVYEDEEQGPLVKSLAVESVLIDHTRRYLRLIESFGGEYPVAVMVTLTGIKGFRIYPDPRRIWDSMRSPIDRDVLPLPRVLAEGPDDDPATLLRPAFDVLWNAAGWPGCMNYDQHGQYRYP